MTEHKRNPAETFHCVRERKILLLFLKWGVCTPQIPGESLSYDSHRFDLFTTSHVNARLATNKKNRNIIEMCAARLLHEQPREDRHRAFLSFLLLFLLLEQIYLSCIRRRMFLKKVLTTIIQILPILGELRLPSSFFFSSSKKKTCKHLPTPSLLHIILSSVSENLKKDFPFFLCFRTPRLVSLLHSRGISRFYFPFSRSLLSISH